MNTNFPDHYLYLQEVMLGLWLWLTSVFVIPCVYLYAIYCCIVELFSDILCKPLLNICIEEWRHSSLLRECPHERRIAVVTGADGTIGTEICRLLLEFNFEVVIFGSKRPQLSYLKDWDRLHLFKCDLLIPNQVHQALNDFQRQFQYVDLCIFGAGTMLHPRLDAPNSIDPHFTINLLSHAMIFDVLRPLMEKSLRTSPKVIALSSATCHLGDVNRFIYGDSKRAFRLYWNGYKSYVDSKLYLTLYIRYLTTMLQGTKIKVVSVHPGVVPGSLYRRVFRPFRFLINNFLKFVVRDKKRAAVEVLNLGFNDAIKSGSFYEHFNAIDFATKYDGAELRRLYNAVQLEIR
ncbi:Retinol dehydrogenase 12 [Aphelenchoides bicaudatus]|nr:Retinol dehydrogenase 12 [Aphelenchoides bicaudatus]